MRIIDPQTAVLTNVEVLAYLTSNPPRRPPNPPPNSRNWVPSPDLRDHNTVVKEIHNYANRLSPHLLRYPRYTARPSSSQSQSQAAMTGTLQAQTSITDPDAASLPPTIPSLEPTPMDTALRDLVTRLQPYGLTKAEVVMILNLGLGLSATPQATEEADVELANGETAMEVDETNGDGQDAEDEGEAAEMNPGDFTAMVLLDAIVEERDLRLSDDDVAAILTIIRETLTADYENIRG
ncbi:hypothetical protein PENANT_c002G02404 [Penicillium antarcticum]|uniref:DNA-directed RNA polymerase III subunit RPC9 n=1 Tax=Penicillium antarcticum TaxID=416450 RepID=A0A1V6QKB7_9EURO|nr:uncharacterized protein N7508_008516 [Penicillium antarcticum]KAJ5293695.1 hypothetical protein N7508_008516 [Penicillium antarcticum]OQD89663.1 hypothetical protein PENANT_c002G02404 [Penicillium antarcticum]